MISKRAVFESGAIVEGGVTIWDFTKICRNAIIREGTRIGSYCEINGIIGSNCKIQSGSYIFEGVVIEDNVFIGPRVTFTNVKHPDPRRKADKYEQTIVHSGAMIGAGAIIICGVTIGKNAVIGAGSVVTKNVPANQTVVGNPAKLIRRD